MARKAAKTIQAVNTGKPTLLTVQTTTGSRVRVYSDAILYAPAQGHGASPGYDTPRVQLPCELYAMSLIGSEQSLRAIGAGCSFNDKAMREVLEIRGPNKTIQARWGPSWNHRTMVLTSGALHMVAIPPVTIAKDVAGETTRHIIITDDDSEEALMEAVYQRLLLTYSTPLIPTNMPGQHPIEQAAAIDWRNQIVSSILTSTAHWQPLRGHPEQIDQTWKAAGVLTMQPKTLDALVSMMVKRKVITLPELSKLAA